MADNLAGQLFSKYESDTASLRKLKQANTDNITKMLSSQTVSPMDMLSVADQAMRPVTGYEVSRGVVRPSVSEVLRASRASDMKYNMDVASLIDKGMDNSAHEMQLVINAMNAETAAGNTQIAPINNVMKSILPTLSPEEGVLFSRAYLGRIGSADGDISDQQAWGAAAEVLSDLNPKGKQAPMKVYNSNGDLVVVDPYAKTADQVYKGTPKVSTTKLPQSRMIYTEESVENPDGSITTRKTPAGEYVPGQGTTGYVSPGITVTPPNGGGQTPSLTSTKSTPSAELKQSPTEAKDLALSQTGLTAAQQLRNELMPNGVVNATRVRQLATGIGGGKYQALFQQAASGIRHDMYGAALTETEAKNFAEAFKPGFLDKGDTVKQKLDGLLEILDSNVKGRSQARKPQAPKDEYTTRQLERAKAAISKGVPKDKVLELLKSKGIDTSGL